MLLLIKYTLLYGIVLMLVALGGMFSEHSGIINIALEGIMVIGGVAGVLTLTMLPASLPAFATVLIAVLVAALAGMVYSLLLAFASINTKEVYRLGNPVIGHKAQTIALAFSMTVYKCTEIFDQVVEDFIKTGVMPTFDIQTSNDDPATSVGRSTKIYNNCVLDGDVLLSMFNAEGDFVEQTLEGYCDSFTRPEKHTNPSYM